MRAVSLAALALMATAPLVPLNAADLSADWWQVNADRASDATRYVDMNSLRDGDIGVTVQTLTVFTNGRAERGVTRINCNAPDPMSEVQAFVCGPRDYRVANGSDVPDDSVARLAENASSDPLRGVSG